MSVWLFVPRVDSDAFLPGPSMRRIRPTRDLGDVANDSARGDSFGELGIVRAWVEIVTTDI